MLHGIPIAPPGYWPKTDFNEVLVVGLQRVQEDGSYVYGVADLDVSVGNAPIWSVRISPDFEA